MPTTLDMDLNNNFNLDKLRFDEDERLDISFGEEYENEQEKLSYLTPKYIAEDSRLITLVNIILDEAIENKATDIQFLSLNSQTGLVRLRIGDEMYPYRRIHGSAMRGIAIVIKSLSRANVDSEVTGQGGRYTHYYNNNFYNLRTSFMPSVYGETTNIRILYGEELDTDIGSLGFPDIVESTLRRILTLREGLVLLTGSTGSGKTTTMYTSIGHIQEQSGYMKNIITIEDPVEYIIAGASQSQVNPEFGYTYEVGLQTALRQNPDVLLIGEIRNPQTASTTVRAATTGHLVFSTLHSNNVLNVSLGMQEYDVTPFALNRSLTLALNQTLPNKLCDYCKVRKPVTTEDLNWIKDLGITEPLTTVHHRVGCDKCEGNGFRGRVLCVSMLDANSIYMNIVADKDKTHEQVEEELLTTEGSNYYPMQRDVHRHLRLGNIDLETAQSILR